jgi:hypothetical protein
MGPRGVPTYPLGIAERWHHNQPSLVKERNPGASQPAGRTSLLWYTTRGPLQDEERAAAKDLRRHSGVESIEFFETFAFFDSAKRLRRSFIREQKNPISKK